VKENILNTSQS
jgi:hypothetical protein